VGGYPAVAVTKTCDACPYPTEVFRITFTNLDPQGRTVTLWPQSALSVLTVRTVSGADEAKVATFYIVDGLNNANYPTGIIGYNTTQNYVNLLVNTPLALYFSATAPLGTTTNYMSNTNGAPFEALFTLTGQYSDKTLYGQTIPFPAGIVTGAKAKLSAYSGGNGATITVSCNSTSGCGLKPNRIATISWIGSNNVVILMTKFTTDASGNIPLGTIFTVPTASSGYYTVMVSDYVNTLFYTFNHA